MDGKIFEEESVAVVEKEEKFNLALAKAFLPSKEQSTAKKR